ncbi:hypothetical protein Sste5346_000278 [Sporothrix stenoceras]|uniref:Myb-like DNA-binding domain-containing protein n=1 Tax=Sporothrix stenoceras TaxID=5173 RepID=A0ABR3ZYV9_9PEZI
MGSSNTGSNNGESSSPAVNTDKAIARLLYAMLKQKSLKDIDWPQVASDPALLETISNGHAARMRYARFRASVDNQVQKKQAAAAALKDGDSKDEEDDKTAVQQTLSRSTSKAKNKEKTRKASGSSVKRLRDAENDANDAKSNFVKTQDADSDEKKDEDFLYPELFLDNSLTDIVDKDNKPNQDPGFPDGKTFEKATEDLLSQTSFTSSLPSPPTESVPSMESIAHQERKKKMRKMYTFSPTMKAGTLHQIPLPRGAAMASSSRIHSLPTLPTTASPSSTNTPVNLSSALMMRHHSAGSMNDIGPQVQQQMFRQSRMMTPSSDSDLLNNPHQSHHQYFAHHTQIPLMTDPAVVSGLDPTFDFSGLSNSAGACAGGSSTTGHPSPWMATPFSSPPMPTFDTSPYSTALDFVGGATNADGSPAGEASSMPSLFQTQFDDQQQQQQEALQASIMAQAFTKHSGWDVMLGQVSSSNQNHNI